MMTRTILLAAAVCGLAATAEESAAAASELDSQAQALSGIVADIAALVGQKRAA